MRHACLGSVNSASACQSFESNPLRLIELVLTIYAQSGPYTGFNDGRGPRPNFRRRGGGGKAPNLQISPKS